jgi:glycosyltransferase involved in cell wall biosynthesis
VTGPARPLAHLAGRALFLVWGPPSHGPRSRALARELGIPIEFIRGTTRRGGWLAPVRYLRQAAATAGLLARRRPRIVFVQSPPSFAPLLVALYGAATGARLVVDAHSDALLSPHWTRPRWLYRWLARRATATVVTNEHFARLIGRQGGTALVVRDVPTEFPAGGSYPLGDGFHIAVVATFAPDEPIGAILDAARQLPDVTFHVTGDPGRIGGAQRLDVPPNVELTGFLPDDAYYALLRGCDAVLCLTTNDNTMQRGACEALSLGRPIITSDWPLLRDYFAKGTVHVDDTAAGIRRGIEQMVTEHDVHVRGIMELQGAQRREWSTAVGGLLDRLGTPAAATSEGERA